MVIDTNKESKTKFKCRAYKLNTVERAIRASFWVYNKTFISVTPVVILVKQSYIYKIKLFCETYSLRASFHLSFCSTFCHVLL